MTAPSCVWTKEVPRVPGQFGEWEILKREILHYLQYEGMETYTSKSLEKERDAQIWNPKPMEVTRIIFNTPVHHESPRAKVFAKCV